ncbi:type I restriction enzyme endonuclease domain-containing protein [Arsenicibacter rosenii]|uniref:Type I restriction enzyme HindI endonuclease subunit-like C-terminal domain-containing protein n=1 Tax=Arsenicibacter rosenii TaxID=1750698 RepID=A0A1S2VSE5_9BACT|nr:type I restriction enzyme endonuclease domain-containing protein [Arsenicibacter rosenii]OIN61206.1 hypothetical protein BLX24_03860 [Arsenicibacter rosenii]
MNNIIANYNNVSSDVEAFFNALKEYAQQLRAEERRAAAEGLTEEELELFDLLFKDNLTDSEKIRVKAAAQDLLQKLQDQEIQDKFFKTDWYKDTLLKGQVKHLIGKILDDHLPDSYDSVFKEKKETVYQHIYKLAEQSRDSGIGRRGWESIFLHLVAFKITNSK